MADEKEVMDAALMAYEQSTGTVPDTRDYVALEDVVHQYVEDENNKE